MILIAFSNIMLNSQQSGLNKDAALKMT